MQDIKNKEIIILAHVLTTVPAQDLKEYFLKKKVKRLLYMGHPLFFVKDRPGPVFELYEKGTLVKQIQYKNIQLPSIIQYIKDVLLSIYWVFKAGGTWDLIISLDNLNTFTGLILRTLGKLKKVIYYTIDFVPKRFDNQLLNSIYHSLEKFAVRYADATWILTDRVAEGREQLLGMNRKIFNRQLIVPIGIWFNRIKRKEFKEVNPHTLVYAGGLAPHQGIQLVLDAIPLIVKQIPDFTFKIIGMGSYEGELKKQSKKLKIDKYVDFLGYMEKHEDVEEILASCGVAAAMYSEELARWSYYADPSKVKTYIATGLPVITTSLTQISEELTKRNCGLVSAYDKQAFADATILIMKDKKKYKSMRENAIKYAQEFEWDNVLTKALGEL